MRGSGSYSPASIDIDRNPMPQRTEWSTPVSRATRLIAAAVASTSAADQVRLHLTPSSPQLAACMPHANVNFTVKLTTDQTGSDVFKVHATGLPPNRDFTTFLIQTPGAPFGAAEYIGDFSSNGDGEASATFNLIVQEAFSSTLVNGVRTRVDLNQVGAWFADPKGDDFCLGKDSPVTPFDGDNEDGVQAFK